MATTTTTYNVTVRNQVNGDARVRYFNTYKEAFNYYCESAADKNIEEDKIEYPETGKEVEITAGGRGCDYRIELEIIEEEI